MSKQSLDGFAFLVQVVGKDVGLEDAGIVAAVAGRPAVVVALKDVVTEHGNNYYQGRYAHRVLKAAGEIKLSGEGCAIEFGICPGYLHRAGSVQGLFVGSASLVLIIVNSPVQVMFDGNCRCLCRPGSCARK